MLHSTVAVFRYHHLTEAAHIKVTFLPFPPLRLLLPPWLPVWMPQGNGIKDLKLLVRSINTVVPSQLEAQPGYIHQIHCWHLHWSSGGRDDAIVLLCVCVSAVCDLKLSACRELRQHLRAITLSCQRTNVRKWAVGCEAEAKCGDKGRNQRMEEDEGVELEDG